MAERREIGSWDSQYYLNMQYYHIEGNFRTFLLKTSKQLLSFAVYHNCTESDVLDVLQSYAMSYSLNKKPIKLKIRNFPHSRLNHGHFDIFLPNLFFAVLDINKSEIEMCFDLKKIPEILDHLNLIELHNS